MYTEIGGDFAVLPAQVVQQRDQTILPGRQASARRLQVGANHKRSGTGRGEATGMDIVQANRRSWIPVSGRGERRSAFPNASPLSPRERVFVAKEILHRSPDAVLRVGLEVQSAPFVEAVHRLNEADHAGARQIIECDARRQGALEAPRNALYKIKILKDCILSGCAVALNAVGGISEFHFRSFLPVVFGAPRASGPAPFRRHEWRGITHSPVA